MDIRLNKIEDVFFSNKCIIWVNDEFFCVIVFLEKKIVDLRVFVEKISEDNGEILKEFEKKNVKIEEIKFLFSKVIEDKDIELEILRE